MQNRETARTSRIARRGYLDMARLQGGTDSKNRGPFPCEALINFRSLPEYGRGRKEKIPARLLRLIGGRQGESGNLGGLVPNWELPRDQTAAEQDRGEIDPAVWGVFADEGEAVEEDA